MLTYFLAILKNTYPPEEIKALYKTALCKVKNVDFSQYFSAKNQLSPSESDELQKIADKLNQNIPLQYILHQAFFNELEFYVDENVLIPRPETEELVHWMFEYLDQNKPLKILDIGTGTGCIALSLKIKNTVNEVFAMDISTKALAIAQRNAKKHQVQIIPVEDSILSPHFASSLDIIVSNPPYITQAEMDAMESHVTLQEPHLALFVNDQDPIIFYKKITDFALKNLNDKGLLFFEINPQYASNIIQYLEQNHFTDIILRKDMQGKNRMIKAQLRG